MVTACKLPKVCLQNLHSQNAAVQHLPNAETFNEAKYEEAIQQALVLLPILSDACVWLLECLVEKITTEIKAGPESMCYSIGPMVAMQMAFGSVSRDNLD